MPVTVPTNPATTAISQDADRPQLFAAADLGTTNGIEVSPDGDWLYVNESVQRACDELITLLRLPV